MGYFLVPALGPVGSEVTLTGEVGHHASVVRRLRVAETITLTDGVGTVAQATVQTVRKGELSARIVHTAQEPLPQPAITVVQAIPKGARAERSIELMTEVGVSAVVPWQAERCNAVWHSPDKQRERWRTIAQSATEQACRAWAPEILPLTSTDQVCVELVPKHQTFILLPEATESLATLSAEAQSALLIIGPEGGITPAEVAALVGAGAQAARLGSTVLRTGTAGAVATAVVSAATGAW